MYGLWSSACSIGRTTTEVLSTPQPSGFEIWVPTVSFLISWKHISKLLFFLKQWKWFVYIWKHLSLYIAVISCYISSFQKKYSVIYIHVIIRIRIWLASVEYCQLTPWWYAQNEPQIKDYSGGSADAHEKDCLDSTQAADYTTFGCIYKAMHTTTCRPQHRWGSLYIPMQV